MKALKVFLLLFSSPLVVNGQNGDPESLYAKALSYEENWQFDSAGFYYGRLFDQLDMTQDSVIRFMAECKIVVCEVMRFRIPESQKKLDVLARVVKSKFSDRLDIRAWFQHVSAIFDMMVDDYESAIVKFCSSNKYFDENGLKHPDEIIISGYQAYCELMLFDHQYAGPRLRDYHAKLIAKYSEYCGGNLVFQIYLGCISHYSGAFEKSTASFEKALEIAGKIPDAAYYYPMLFRWYAATRMNYADLSKDTLLRREEYASARDLLITGLELARDQGASYKMANCYTMLGRANNLLEGKELASIYFDSALIEMDKAIPYPSDEQINIVGEYARIYYASGDYERALHLIKEGLRRYDLKAEATGFEFGLRSEVFWISAKCYFELGKMQPALYAVQKAMLLHNNHDASLFLDLRKPDNSQLAKYREALEMLAFKIKILDSMNESEPCGEFGDLVTYTGAVFDTLFQNVFTEFEDQWSRSSLQEVVYDTYSILVSNHVKVGDQDNLITALRYSEKTRAIQMIDHRWKCRSGEVLDYFASFHEKRLTDILESSAKGFWIEYFEGKEDILAFYPVGDRIYVHTLGSTQLINQKIDRYTEMLRDFPSQLFVDVEDYERYMDRFVSLTSSLCKLLIPSDFRLIDKWVIIPHGHTSKLAFAALFSDSEVLDSWDYRFLLKDHEIRYVPSLFLLEERVDNFGGNRIALDGTSPDMIYGKEEIKWLEHNQGFQRKPLNECSLQQTSEEGFDIQHIICHAGVSEDGAPYLLLSDDQENRDTIFTSDIEELDGGLVFLAACDTKVGAFQRGEGTLSLTRHFLQNGASAVISTLWPLRDGVSDDLIRSFYSQEVGTASARLRRAKLDHLIQAKNYLKHPYYWGGMIYTGGLGVISPWQSDITTLSLGEGAIIVFVLMGLLLGKYSINRIKKSPRRLQL